MGLIDSINNYYMADKQKCFDDGLVKFEEGETLVYEPDKAVGIQNAKAYMRHLFSLNMTGKALIAFVSVTTKNVWIYNRFQQIKIPLESIEAATIEKKLFLQFVVITTKDGSGCTFTFGQTGALKSLNHQFVNEVSRLITTER